MARERLAELIAASDNIVFFGGAGTSTESNIPDFRSEQGLAKMARFRNYPLEKLLSYSFFMEYPEEFFSFYKDNLVFGDAKPNLAHYALAELEKAGKLKAIITQNIDGLHQQAGSKKVLELHGSVYKNYCMDCKTNYQLVAVVDSDRVIPRCGQCGGIIRPDVILYEEQLDMTVIEQAITFISQADMLIVGGTSLVVYPAAGMINFYQGEKLVLINKAPTSYDSRANLVINDSVGKILDYGVKKALQS